MKTHTQEQHNANAEYLERMQKGLGHHSWWYTNRSSDDCINVKVHAWVDTDKVLQLLTQKEREAVDVLGIDVADFCEDIKWSVLVEDARMFLLEELQGLDTENETVHEIEYGGRSGGWLAVVYHFDLVGDYCEGHEHVKDLYETKAITKKEWAQWCKNADAAIAHIEKVHAKVKELHRGLEQAIEDPQSYIDPLRDYIEDQKYKLYSDIEVAEQKLEALA